MAVNWKKVLGITAAALGTTFVAASIVAAKKKGASQYENEPEQKNPMEGKKVVFIEDENDKENADGVKGHLEAVGESEPQKSVYTKYVKRGLDIVLSFGGLVVLSPVLAGIAIAIKIDDPGPVLFTQKRVGENKKYFKLHKFRSMKMSTPHDKPTHMLENPEQYITRVGKFLRAHSLDELPQIWDIFIGNMSVIGPRPALWNQDYLTSERDKYGANDIKPGLTGWAQINGRDELEIEEKARLDGEYAEKAGFSMDAKVFLGSLHVIGGDDSVVEGGTGTIAKDLPLPSIAICHDDLDFSDQKKILVCGANSYIGKSFISYLSAFDNYEVDSISVRNDEWEAWDFSKYDVVYDVAGIAHIQETDENRQLYYDVNRDLAVALAEKAKTSGVKQFIYLSSMSVYGLAVGRIGENTAVSPVNAYGKSKLEAEKMLWQLNDENFVVSIVRPPMVYGAGCKGNYQTLRKFALKFGFFPEYNNERSMLYIDNLSSAIRGIIHNNEPGLYFPQNSHYVRTYDLVKEIAEANGKRFHSSKLLNGPVYLASKKIEICKKVFGTLTYDQILNVPNKWISAIDKEQTVSRCEDNKVALKTEVNDNTLNIKARIVHILKHNTTAQTVYRYSMSGFFKTLGCFIKTDEHLVLMNGHSSKYNDSPRAIYRKMQELGMLQKYNVVWALNDPDQYDIPGCKKIKMDTTEYFITALKAKYWISCVNIERALHFKKKDTIYLNTWHGALINLCGNAVGGRNDFHWDYINYFCVCGDYEKPFIIRDFGVKESALIMTGYPRNDELYAATEETKKQYREKFSIPENKKVILYAPTWRETTDGGASYQLTPPIDWDKWKEKLGSQYVVLLRTHPYTTKLMNVKFNDFVRDYTEYPEVNHLLIAADILISDYSSINLDYCILGKPMICFGYDYETYTKDRGFYYDLRTTMPGGVVETEDDVIKRILTMDYDKEIKETCTFRDAHMQYGGNASVECINRVFGTQY